MYYLQAKSTNMILLIILLAAFKIKKIRFKMNLDPNLIDLKINNLSNTIIVIKIHKIKKTYIRHQNYIIPNILNKTTCTMTNKIRKI